MLKAIKIRLYLNDDQKNYTNKLLGSTRFVYNSCLSFKIDQYQNYKKSVSFGEIGKHLVNLKQKEEFNWLKAGVVQRLLISSCY